MEPFSVDTINLSMRHHETDLPLTANVYSIPGVNNDRPMSIGQLVMAICLARATDLEARLIELMQEMDQTSADLERLTEIEKKVIAGTALTDEEREYLEDLLGLSFRRSNADIAKEVHGLSSLIEPDALLFYFRLISVPDYQPNEEEMAMLERHNISLYAVPGNLVTQIESKMDSMNSFSQEKMIELQSQTNKRDQSYDMAANILKSLNTVLIGTANNI